MRIFISNGAYADIISEVLENLRTETGGILIGITDGESWYIVESLDPGPRAVLRRAYFEYDQPYVTHLANKVRRRYKRKVKLLGLWHRHPGSMDFFSSTDDHTNQSFLTQCGGRAISGLVNLDPAFRLTFYEVSGPSIHYRKVPVCIGSELFPAGLLDNWDGISLLKAAGVQSARGDAENTSRPCKIEEANLYEAEPPSRFLDQSVQEAPYTRRLSPSPNTSWTFDEAEHLGSKLEEFPALGMLDSELEYLEEQMDYAYELERVNHDIRLILTRATGLSESPGQLTFVFAVREGARVIISSDGDRKFYPGIVRVLVNDAIAQKSSAFDQSDAHPTS